MKRAILISAGRGSRLGVLTENSPKCLAIVDGRAILDHQIMALRENGVDDIHIVVGFRHESVRQHISHIKSTIRPNVITNPFWSVSSSIGSVWAARHVLNEQFCLINGDTVFDEALFRSALGRVSHGVNLFVDAGPLEPDDMRVQVEGARVSAVGKCLPDRKGLLRSLGIIISAEPDGNSYLDALEQIIMQPTGHLSYHHAIIDLLAKKELVHAVQVGKGCWKEIDRPEDIKKYEESIKTKVSVE